MKRTMEHCHLRTSPFLSALSGLCRAALVLSLYAACGDVWGQAAPDHTVDPLVSQLGAVFTSGNAKVNGTTLHFVQGGNGPAVILLHGFPQDWYEFHKIMPRLAAKFTVVAVDLRGVGGSAPAADGYDAANLAEDIHQLIAQLPLQKVYLVGHDIGGMVAYAFARRFPQDARGIMILDVALPGLDPWPEILGDPALWHVRFHQTDLPEKLVTGRQFVYFRFFLGSEHFTDADVAHYAAAYRDPDHLRSAFETYRAFPANETFNAPMRNNIELPMVFGAGEHDAFTPYLPKIAEAMRAHGCVNLQTEIVKGSAHYIFDEQPDLAAALIEKYASSKN
jgi:pimeloyl-ACP methyl ester carboxylesterase